MDPQRTCVAGEDEDVALHLRQWWVPLQQCLGGGDIGGCDPQGGIHGCMGDRFRESEALRDWAMNLKGFLWSCLAAQACVPAEV